MTDAHDKYLQSQVMTAAPEKLVLMLYDATIRFITQAKADIAGGDASSANENLCRAQAIIAELMSSLDFEYGEVSVGLFSVYQFFYERLVEANLAKDSRILDEVTPLLDDLRRAWRESQAPGQTPRPTGTDSTFSAVQ